MPIITSKIDSLQQESPAVVQPLLAVPPWAGSVWFHPEQGGWSHPCWTPCGRFSVTPSTDRSAIADTPTTCIRITKMVIHGTVYVSHSVWDVCAYVCVCVCVYVIVPLWCTGSWVEQERWLSQPEWSSAEGQEHFLRTVEIDIRYHMECSGYYKSLNSCILKMPKHFLQWGHSLNP